MKKLAKRITGKEWGMIIPTILFTCFSVYLELEVTDLYFTNYRVTRNVWNAVG